MFAKALGIDMTTLSPLEKRAGRALDEGKYDLFYRFDPDDETLTYYAFLKGEEDSLPPLLACRMGRDGLSMPYRGEASPVPFRPLALYLQKAEEGLDDEARATLYGKDGPNIEDILSMDDASYLRHRDVRNDFLSLLSEIESEEKSDGSSEEDSAQSEKNTLYFSFSSAPDEHYVELKIVLTRGRKSLVVPSPRQLASLYVEKRPLPFKKGFIPLAKDEFAPPFDEAMDILARALAFPGSVRFEEKPRSAYIPTERAIDLLFRLSGEEVSFFSIQTALPVVEEGKVGLDEKRGIYIVPELGGGLIRSFFSKEKAVIVEGPTSEPKIRLILFKEKKSALLYRFFLEHGVDAGKEIVDLLPRLRGRNGETPFLVAPKEEAATGPKIDLYVSFEEGKGLRFLSKYSLNNQEIAPYLFIADPVAKSLRDTYLRELRAAGGKETGLLREGEAVSFLSADLASLMKLASIHLDGRIARRERLAEKDIEVSASYDGNWLALTLSSPKYGRDELAAVYKASEEGRRFVVLKDRTVILAPKGEESPLSDLSRFEIDGTTLVSKKLPLYMAIPLIEEKGDCYALSIDGRCEEAFARIKDYRNEKPAVEEKLVSSMRDYQIEAVKWLVALEASGFSGILADDMGLGKTIEAIAYFSTIDSPLPILVASPKSLLYNWESEIRRFLPKLDVKVIDGNKAERLRKEEAIGSEGKAAYLISYDSLRNDIDALKPCRFSLFVLDEAQFIKNGDTKKARSSKEIVSERRLALTGTPIENSLSDLWSIFDFLMPGYLGSEKEFLSQYEKGEEGRKRRLDKMIKPFVLRRKKEEVLSSLPPKSEIVVPVSLEEDERMLYEAHLREAREELGERKASAGVLAALTRLREICVDPSSFLSVEKEISSKLALVELMAEQNLASGHRLLVFSSFARVLRHLEKLLSEKGISTHLIVGDTPAEERFRLAADFNEGRGGEAMLVSLKAGGTGLNLVGADTVIHLDPWWNKAAEEQASDRAHRIGQTRPVTVYRLVCKDTIEEKVLALQEKKKRLFDDYIHSGEEGVSGLTYEDIAFLLS